MMLRSRAVVLSMAAAVCLALSSTARADDTARAAELFREADQAAARGSAGEAARLYAEAHHMAPHAITKYNEALEWEKAGERPRAADAYQAALDRRELDGLRVRDARARLAALRKQLGYLKVSQPAGGTVSVAHAQGATVPMQIHLTPGEHEVRVELGACARAERVRVSAATTHELAVACVADPAPPPVAAPPSQAPMAQRPRQPDRAQPPHSTVMRDAGWVVAAVGAAGALSAIPLGVIALDANADWKDGLTDEDAHQRALSFRTATNVVLGVSAALLVTGITLVLVSPKSPPRATRSGTVSLRF